MYKHCVKRVLSFLGALLALILVGWLIVFVAIFLHFANKGAGAFFTQERPGYRERIFRLIPLSVGNISSFPVISLSRRKLPHI